MVGEGNESGQDREATTGNSESASEDGESVSGGTRSAIETPELKRLPRSHRGGLQHLLQEPGAANAGFP